MAILLHLWSHLLIAFYSTYTHIWHNVLIILLNEKDELFVVDTFTKAYFSEIIYDLILGFDLKTYC